MSNGKKWICNFTEKILYLEKLKKKTNFFFPREINFRTI